jgi:hypothetical protein
MDHDRRNANTPATQCATGIGPVAVSLSNAPPTASPSSVMIHQRITLPETHPHSGALGTLSRTFSLRPPRAFRSRVGRAMVEGVEKTPPVSGFARVV